MRWGILGLLVCVHVCISVTIPYGHWGKYVMLFITGVTIVFVHYKLFKDDDGLGK